MNNIVFSQIEEFLNEKIVKKIVASGGCFSQNYILSTKTDKNYFLKTGLTNGIFTCEANGLQEIVRSTTIRVPKVLLVSENFLLLENIPKGRTSESFFRIFGTQFAKLHQFRQDKFGFYENNFIGSNHQINKPLSYDWLTFYWENRLVFQYRLAEKKGYLSRELKRNFSQLEKKLPHILTGSEERPSLLHGDLWSGNFLCDDNNQPVLIDPAAYYGHREADLAMTRLFGGFPASFYEAYQLEYPLPEGYEYRENIYKLYHILNHLNLFGTGYLFEAEYLSGFYL